MIQWIAVAAVTVSQICTVWTHVDWSNQESVLRRVRIPIIQDLWHVVGAFRIGPIWSIGVLYLTGCSPLQWGVAAVASYVGWQVVKRITGRAWTGTLGRIFGNRQF